MIGLMEIRNMLCCLHNNFCNVLVNSPNIGRRFTISGTLLRDSFLEEINIFKMAPHFFLQK